VPYAYFLPFFALCFFALCFAHPVAVTGVDWWSVIPFCATNAVGILSLLVQRFPFAAYALFDP
jgi:hypothetical protein